MTTATLKTPRAAPASRADELMTKRAVLETYARGRSPRLMLGAIAVVAAARLLLGGWGWADLAVIGFIVAIVGPFEWVVHRVLLHAPEGSRRMRVLGTGVGHRKHHLDPPDVKWLMLLPSDVAQFLPMLAATAAVIVIPGLWLTGSPLLGPWLTAVLATYVGLAHYEWTHLLVHSRYRLKSRYYARLARNHRLHHFRNERYWFGVTSNSGDRLLRTLPASKTDVPLSDTARSLA